MKLRKRTAKFLLKSAISLILTCTFLERFVDGLCPETNSNFTILH